MKSQRIALACAAAMVVAVAVQDRVQAQVFIHSAPAVSYYTPPTVSYYAPPAAVPAPAVSYYAPPVTYVTPSTVNYYVAPQVNYYPVRVRRGLFGRTTVTTPFYRLRY